MPSANNTVELDSLLKLTTSALYGQVDFEDSVMWIVNLYTNGRRRSVYKADQLLWIKKFATSIAHEEGLLRCVNTGTVSTTNPKYFYIKLERCGAAQEEELTSLVDELSDSSANGPRRAFSNASRRSDSNLWDIFFIPRTAAAAEVLDGVDGGGAVNVELRDLGGEHIPVHEATTTTASQQSTQGAVGPNPAPPNSPTRQQSLLDRLSPILSLPLSSFSLSPSSTTNPTSSVPTTAPLPPAAEVTFRPSARSGSSSPSVANVATTKSVPNISRRAAGFPPQGPLRDAIDRIQCATDPGVFGIPLETYETCWVKRIKFHEPQELAELLMLLLCIHDRHPHYDLFSFNCFWFTATFMDIVKTHYEHRFTEEESSIPANSPAKLGCAGSGTIHVAFLKSSMFTDEVKAIYQMFQEKLRGIEDRVDATPL